MFNNVNVLNLSLFFKIKKVLNVRSLNKFSDINHVITKKLCHFFRVYKKEFSFFELNNFMIFFNFVDINLYLFSHVEITCFDFLHLKQRFYFERIYVSLLINRSTAFDEKLNKRNLLSKKNFRKNDKNAKIMTNKIKTSKNIANRFHFCWFIRLTTHFVLSIWKSLSKWLWRSTLRVRAFNT